MFRDFHCKLDKSAQIKGCVLNVADMMQVADVCSGWLSHHAANCSQNQPLADYGWHEEWSSLSPDFKSANTAMS